MRHTSLPRSVQSPASQTHAGKTRASAVRPLGRLAAGVPRPPAAGAQQRSPRCCGRDGTCRALRRPTRRGRHDRIRVRTGPRLAVRRSRGRCIVVAGWIVGGRGGGPSAPTVPAPSHLALVYAKPVGGLFVARREVIYAASPADTHPRRLAVGTSPLLSPDGNWVAYLGGELDHPTDVRLISTLGGAPRVAGISGQPLVWSPDWRLLAVQGPDGLAMVDARSLRTTAIRLPAGSEGFSFSPDGTMLAFQHSTGAGSDIYTVDRTGGAIHRLTDDHRSGFPLWGPGWIAFERFGTDRCMNCHGDVWVTDRAAATPTSSPTPALASIPRRGRPTDGVCWPPIPPPTTAGSTPSMPPRELRGR